MITKEIYLNHFFVENEQKFCQFLNQLYYPRRLTYCYVHLKESSYLTIHETWKDRQITNIASNAKAFVFWMT